MVFKDSWNRLIDSYEKKSRSYEYDYLSRNSPSDNSDVACGQCFGDEVILINGRGDKTYMMKYCGFDKSS
jgi:hypothetical protein